MRDSPFLLFQFVKVDARHDRAHHQNDQEIDQVADILFTPTGPEKP